MKHIHTALQRRLEVETAPAPSVEGKPWPAIFLLSWGMKVSTWNVHTLPPVQSFFLRLWDTSTHTFLSPWSVWTRNPDPSHSFLNSPSASHLWKTLYWSFSFPNSLSIYSKNHAMPKSAAPKLSSNEDDCIVDYSSFTVCAKFPAPAETQHFKFRKKSFNIFLPLFLSMYPVSISLNGMYWNVWFSTRDTCLKGDGKGRESQLVKVLRRRNCWMLHPSGTSVSLPTRTRCRAEERARRG